MKRYSLFILSLLLLFILSCSRPLEEMTYMYGIQDSVYPYGPVPDIYEIRINDHLYIQVVADDPENAAFLNLAQAGAAGTGNNPEFITYIVDENGDIFFLLLGKIRVAELTVNEVREILQEKVDRYLENTSVFVKLVGQTITVLGEVERPGTHMMARTRLSIFQAIGIAGDVTDWGNYKEAMLLRETPEGKLVATVDLQNPNLIDSPYYYILPNDVLYVKLDKKVRGSKNVAPFTGITLALAIITTALVVATFFQ